MPPAPLAARSRAPMLFRACPPAGVPPRPPRAAAPPPRRPAPRHPAPRGVVARSGLGSEAPDDYVRAGGEDWGRRRSDGAHPSTPSFPNPNPNPQIMSEAAYDAALASADVVVVDFMARWCRKCEGGEIEGGRKKNENRNNYPIPLTPLFPGIYVKPRIANLMKEKDRKSVV